MRGIRIFPDTFIDTVHRIFREEGEAWLETLPAIIRQCHEKWGLKDGEICPNLSINYIEFTHTPQGEPVALKVGVPNEELYTEIDALGHWAGNGAVRLIDADLELGAFLIHRVQPGTLLWRLSDNSKETGIASSIMHRLHIPSPAKSHFPRFSRWVERAFRLTRTEWDPQELMPRVLIDRAEQAFWEIERTSVQDVLLHGDLHHENILFDDKAGWIAIDPKGVLGPACLEVGRFIQNQLPVDNMQKVIRERLEIFSDELEVPVEFLAASALVDVVLSHCWSFEDSSLDAGWFNGIMLGYLLCEMIDL